MEQKTWPYIKGQEKHSIFINELLETIVDASIDDVNYHVFNIDQDTIKYGVFYIWDEFYQCHISIDLRMLDKWDAGFYDRNISYYSDLLIEKILANVK